jgi:VWFA-related protein
MAMRRKPRLISLAVFLLLVSTSSQLGQIRTRVDLVVVPVSVRDNNGFLIPGLTLDDFLVLEDGKPQKIANFSSDVEPLSAAIVIDDGISGKALRRVADLLPSITSAFTPDDELTSYRYDSFVWRLSDFTSDQQKIERSFRELIQMAALRPEEREQPELYNKIERTPAIVRALAGLFGGGTGGAPGTVPSAQAPRPARGSRMMHSAVYEALTALRGRPDNRRKIILLISDGIVSEPPTSIIPGKTLRSFNQNVDLLLKADVEVYAVNTLGDLLEKPSGTLGSYARATGGDVYGGRSDSDLKFAVSRIAEQARTQYVLGYVSSNTAPRQGVYRKIEVRSGDPEQERKVIHRQGYTQYPTAQ